MKRIFIVIISIILIVSLVGCKKNDLENFKQAVNKTSKIQKGQMSVQSITELDIDSKDLTKEEIKNLNYIRKVEVDLNIMFDDVLNKIITRTYFNLGGLGFDSVFYDDGEKKYLKLPILGKYMLLNSENMNNEYTNKNVGDKEEFITEDTKNFIKNKWLSILKEDDVFSGEESILTTPDGEVKVTHYTINMTNEQIKALLNEMIDAISKDKKLKASVKKYIRENEVQIEEFSMKQFFDKFKENINKSTISNFTYDAYIDIDGYIIDENIQIEIKFDNSAYKNFKGMMYSLNIKRWDIEKEQEFDFPNLNKENLLEMQDMEQGVPFMLENMFKID